ncbi:molecular chaperone HscC [Litorimonas cladophorae]|uniref:Molecular chaperone HscC n=1 Tax=Litorimonas cladophorae TaxID=1220491 RepID=A0A918NC83_9PROT|nr:molecular chaperone HscC [Litorimonas cladophorae]GGX57214.1 molecular chaperone HscC [Litorimonas cladophorae]
MALVGIDLGTTNSLISVFTDEGPKLITNGTGSFLTPSVVGLSDQGDIIVGEAAKHRLVTHPEKTVARFKRAMGTAKQHQLGKTQYKAEDLSALVLRSLKADAEKYLGETVDRAIISVPAYFNDIQRKATYAAGKMAGLKVERLINEPTAAALAYGLSAKEDENTFLVIDLGGGTFDVSILEIFDGVMEVRSSAGDAFLGGEDFTTAVEDYFLTQLETPREKMKPKDLGRLRDLANKAKVALSEKTNVTVKFLSGKIEKELTLDRAKFEDLTQKLQSRMRMPLQRAISDAGLRSSDIERIILVGGATRMPVIRAMVTRLLKKFPEHSIDPDEVIALGTGVQSGLLDRHEALEDVVMTDVCPFTLGTDIAREVGPNQYESGYFQPIIERNTVIPASRVVRNSTIRPGQDKVGIQVYQGESPRVEDNVPLGEITINLPKEKDKHQDFDIRFTYDVSGVLEVLVTVVGTGKTEQLILEGNPGSLSQAEIAKRLKALDKLKIHPRDVGENAAIINRLKAAYENHLGDIRAAIEHNLVQFEHVLSKQNDTDIKLARDAAVKFLDELDRMDVF